MFPLFGSQAGRPPQPEVRVLGLGRVLANQSQRNLLGLGPSLRGRARSTFTKPSQDTTLGTALPAGRPDVALVVLRSVLEMIK